MGDEAKDTTGAAEEEVLRQTDTSTRLPLDSADSTLQWTETGEVADGRMGDGV